MSDALRTLGTALSLYGRHVFILTVISLLPALARIALFLDVPWLSGTWVGIVEAMVGILRFVLLYVAFRIVFPGGLAELGLDTAGKLKLRINRHELVWQLFVLAWVPLILNSVSGVMGRIVAVDPQAQTAVTFALKNLIVIPVWMVHMLVAVRRAFKV